MRLTEADLTAMRSRCDAATPGPWKPAEGDLNGTPDRWSVVVDGPKGYFVAVIENGQPGDTLETEKATAAFIATARQDVPALLAEVDRLKVLVREAYEEGFINSTNEGDHFGPARQEDIDEGWGYSNTKAAL